VTPRQVAFAVRKATHPIHWTNRAGVLISPPVSIEGEDLARIVEVRESRFGALFPTVTLVPGETFTSYSPWGWPSTLIRLFKNRERQRDETRRRLLAAGLEERREGDR